MEKIAEPKLKLRTLVAYGTAALGGGMMDYAMMVYLMFFYADTVKIGAGLAGLAVMLANLWDAVTDPAMGYISDHTRSSMGRRRPYILAAAVPLGLCFFLLWSPLQSHPVAHLAISYILLYTFLTVFYVPYDSLAAELSLDYDERTRVQGFRQGFFMVGLFFGALLPLPIVSLFPNERIGFSAVGAIFGIVAALGLLVTFVGVRERPEFQRRPQVSFLEGARKLIFNKGYNVVVISYALYNMAVTTPAAIVLFAAKYWLKISDATTLIVILTYLAFAVMSVPFWVKLSKVTSKKSSYMAALVLSLVAACSCYFLKADVRMYLIFAASGAGYGGLMVVLPAALGDLVDEDELETGDRREGAYFGLWTLVRKASTGVTWYVVGKVLDLAGYVPDTEQSARTILGMRLLISAFPAVLFILGIIVFLWYPMSRERHLEILEQLAARKESASNEDQRGSRLP